MLEPFSFTRRKQKEIRVIIKDRVHALEEDHVSPSEDECCRLFLSMFEMPSTSVYSKMPPFRMRFILWRPKTLR